RKTGVTLALNVAEETIADGQRTLGLKEGFDVGLEMSGNPHAMRDMVANMTHGGKIAMLGLPSEDFAVDWAKIVTSMITVKGIYGREMFETWYAMSVLLEGGLDLAPVITGRYGFRDFEAAFDDAASGLGGKVILDWTA
ncbi:zinc-binding dehydrogenase, partial [Streptomyces sp. NPDC056295]|uniref:zinc-binding dehydrogenase n=1 Tax=Streptomyces sp. NPDC056295 TaxID=3345774 RepID=UPI0035E07913